MAAYAISREVDYSLAEAEERVRDALDAEGFGVLTKIDIAAKLREKLNVSFRDYIILGACNPPNAYKALEVEEQLGLLLPCNVIVYRKGEKTVVAAVKPSVAMGMIDNEALAGIAEGIETKLTRVIESV
jgi:uncharacterized protein (DUF302 family)